MSRAEAIATNRLIETESEDDEDDTPLIGWFYKMHLVCKSVDARVDKCVFVGVCDVCV